MSLRINYNLIDDIGVDLGGSSIYHYQGIGFTGIVEFYDHNGVLEAELEYKNGFHEGFEREYYSNGQLEFECHIYRNMFVGTYKKWNESGQLIRHLIYKNGDLIETIL